MKPRALLIDLDDTLYDERTYVLSGFQAVAAGLAERFPGLHAGLVFEAMVAELDTNGRGEVFDRVLAEAGLRAEVGELVQMYREHPPHIALWPGVADTLTELRREHRIAIVTDGLGVMQRRKVAALRVEPLVDAVLYCWEHESPKPHPGPYAEALRRLSVTPEEAVVIGDNPAHDIAAARALGCRSVRVLTGRFTAEPGQADATVASFTEVPAVLGSLA
ncbi:HAD family hydrolase [Phenylobacterium sp.]|jgi:putative hydrolase of the HAD superfamily|uniref:HAD family hydrolase n=1 Tax=Phenylobacterium sp. TaxID=1871053 RepID=UPI002F958717